MATLDNGYLSSEYLRIAFNYFDTNNEGFISAKSMEKSFVRALKTYDPSEIDDMFFEAFGKHKVSFQEFQALMIKDLDQA